MSDTAGMEQDHSTTNMTGKTGTLSKLRPRDTHHAKASSAGYTRFVGVLRWVLPTLIVIAMAVLILWPRWGDNTLSLTVENNVPNLMIEKLNLSGLDSKNQPYTLTADRALQAANTKNLVDLQKPKGELALEDGTWLAGHADYGRLDQSSKKLWLGGNVELFHDKGYRFSSSEMNVDMTQSAAWGEQPVVIQGGFGEIHGEGFRLLEGGKIMVITGKSSARLNLRSGAGSGKPDAGPDKPESKPNINHSPSR